MGAPTAVPVEPATVTLFVAGAGHRSRQSIQQAQRLADRFAHLTLRVIDVIEDPAAAESALILVVPSLVLACPGRSDQIVAGDLPPATDLAEHLGLVTPTPHVDVIDRERAIARIWDNNPDGIILVDADRTIAFLNPACEALLGRAAADLIGTPLDFSLATDGPTELDIPRGDQLTTVELRTAAITWEGRPAVMATLRDVTEQKRLLDELETTRADLARSNEDLERFATTAAHDLQSPLGVISGAVHLLCDGHSDPSDADREQLVEIVTRSVSKMTLLLDAVLDAARAGSDLELQPTDLGSLVREVEEGLRAQLADIDAIVDLRPLPTLLVDPDLMTAVFQNLLSNAIKYRSPERPLRIEVSSEQRDGGVVISVSDNGIGIQPGDRERVFTMLDRLPEGKLVAEGHGIGLSVCRRLIERHGGRIWVDDSPEGASFRFSLPSSVS